jgi:hypothetical protein
MASHHESPQQANATATVQSIDRTITQVSLAEDGWAVEVEDEAGVRLTYWIADLDSVPSAGAVARFYHRYRDRRLCALEIDGQFVFDACQDQFATSHNH